MADLQHSTLAPSRRVVWLRDVSTSLLPELRSRGFHTGFRRDLATDQDLGLRAIFNLPGDFETRVGYLRYWIAEIQQEAAQLDGVCTIWLPSSGDEQKRVIRAAAGDALEERRGTTLADVVGCPARQTLRAITRIATGQPSAFNGALLTVDGRARLLVYRATEPRLAACLLDAKFDVVLGTEVEDLGIDWHFDPRLLWHQGKPYMSTGRLNQRNDRISLWPIERVEPLMLGQVIDFQTVIDLPDPPAREKNWAPLSYGGELLYVYSIQPHRILRVNLAEGSVRLVHETTWRTPDVWGEAWGTTFLGSTPPVQLADGTFLSTFHTHGVGGYYFAFYRFEGEPPFRVMSMSVRPLLTPLTAREHNWRNPNARCMFILSMEIEQDTIHICGGDNDRQVVVIDAALPDVLAELVSV